MGTIRFAAVWFFAGVGIAIALLTVWLKFTNLNSLHCVDVVTTMLWPTSRMIGSWVGPSDNVKLTKIFAEAVIANGLLYACAALGFRRLGE